MRKIEDITRELSALESRMSFALQHCGIGIWEWIVDSNDVIWDSNMLRLFGVTSAEYNTDNFFTNVVHPDDAELVKTTFKRSIDCDDPVDISYRIRYNEGYKRIRMRGTVRCDEFGHNRRLIGVAFEDMFYCARTPVCEQVSYAKPTSLQYSL